MSVLTAIDKLDKIGVARVQEELTGRGFNAEGLQPLWSLMERKPDNEGCLDASPVWSTREKRRGLHHPRNRGRKHGYSNRSNSNRPHTR